MPGDAKRPLPTKRRHSAAWDRRLSCRGYRGKRTGGLGGAQAALNVALWVIPLAMSGHAIRDEWPTATRPKIGWLSPRREVSGGLRAGRPMLKAVHLESIALEQRDKARRARAEPICGFIRPSSCGERDMRRQNQIGGKRLVEPDW